MEKSKLISLKHLRVLEISGKGAFDLLQGQITCDIEKIKSERSALGALCNAKGRVVSSFIVYLIKKDTYGLIMPKETLEITSKEFSKYTPFYDVVTKDNDSLLFYAMKKSDFLDQHTKDFTTKRNTIEINGNKFIDYLEKKYLLVISNYLGTEKIKDSSDIELDISDWDLDEILSLNFEISETSSGLHTPHELSYDKNRIDFDKGCYTGQEIVARMHYRSKNLPRLSLAKTKDITVNEHMVVADEDSKKVAKILRVVNLENESYCLISAKQNNINGPIKILETDSIISVI